MVVRKESERGRKKNVVESSMLPTLHTDYPVLIVVIQASIFCLWEKKEQLSAKFYHMEIVMGISASSCTLASHTISSTTP